MSAPAGLVARTPVKTASGRVRVLIVDDSLVIRHLVRQALEEDPAIEVVGAEANGVSALARIPVVKPDVVTLDIEMPEMDGLETLRHIRKRFPRLRTIMFSTLTTRGGSATFEALSAGADDYVAKAANAGSLDRSLAALRSELIPKVKQFFSSSAVRSVGPAMTAAARTAAATNNAPALAPVKCSLRSAGKVEVVGIGVSTGGPQALAQLIPALPRAFPVPILVVQHMPDMFTRLLAERLAGLSAIEVVEAENALPLQPGRVVIARGDHHLRVQRDGQRLLAVLDQEPHENSCRPAADVLFRSLVEVFGSHALSVVLTGMGFDGRRGVEAIKRAGGYSLAQDQASSVVWGMPGAVVEAGLADQVLPLSEIPSTLIRLVSVRN